MKKLSVGLLTCLAILALSLAVGCCYPESAVTDALRDSWQLIRPCAEFGIENNPSLDADSKVTRLRVVAEFTDLIEEMYKQSQEKEEN